MASLQVLKENQVGDCFIIALVSHTDHVAVVLLLYPPCGLGVTATNLLFECQADRQPRFPLQLNGYSQAKRMKREINGCCTDP